jgi:hypothetical protein
VARQFNFEREAQEGSDDDDHRQHADARERWRDGNRADDVARNQELKPKEDAATNRLP